MRHFCMSGVDLEDLKERLKSADLLAGLPGILMTQLCENTLLEHFHVKSSVSGLGLDPIWMSD